MFTSWRRILVLFSRFFFSVFDKEIETVQRKRIRIKIKVWRIAPHPPPFPATRFPHRSAGRLSPRTRARCGSRSSPARSRRGWKATRHKDELGDKTGDNSQLGELLNRFACYWPKGYQRESLGKSLQNGDYLKTSNAKKLHFHRN